MSERCGIDGCNRYVGHVGPCRGRCLGLLPLTGERCARRVGHTTAGNGGGHRSEWALAYDRLRHSSRDIHPVTVSLDAGPVTTSSTGARQ